VPRPEGCQLGGGLASVRISRGGGDIEAVQDLGDNSVSSCRLCSRATGPGTTSAGVFPVALSLSGEGPRRSSTGCEGGLWDPQDPLS
jgi:hypothetical protein